MARFALRCATALCLLTSLLIGAAVAQQAGDQGAKSADSQTGAVPGGIPGPSQEKLALIKELIAVTNLADNTKQILQDLPQTLGAGISGILKSAGIDEPGPKSLTPEQEAAKKKAIEEFTAKEMRVVAERLTSEIDFPDMVEQVYVPLYDKYYSEKDLRDLIGFYKTPAGQKLIGLTPQITRDAGPKTMEIMIPAVQRGMAKAREQMEKDAQQFATELQRIIDASTGSNKKEEH